MSMPSPFELGAATGKSLSGAFGAVQDKSAIDDILSQASQSTDPNAMDNIMSQLIQRVHPDRQQAAAQILQNKKAQLVQNKQKNQQQETYQALGLNPKLANLPENLQKEYLKQNATPKVNEDLLKTQTNAKNALDLIGEQRKLLKKGNLGPKIAILGTGRNYGSTFTEEGIRDRSQYKQIGKALVQAAAPLKITNKAEFQHYAEALEDPNLKQEEIEGILNGMERIVKNSLGENNNINIQPTIQQAQDNLFSGKNNAEFERSDGSKIKVSKGNDKQLISSLSQGYAPKGFVSMMNPEGYPVPVPQNGVQEAMNNGYIVIYGY